MQRSYDPNGYVKWWVTRRLVGDALAVVMAATALALSLWMAQRVRGLAVIGVLAVGAAAVGIVATSWLAARREWRHRMHSAAALHPEGLRCRTSFGLVVRSQAEAQIAEELHAAGLRFWYERRLVAPDMTSRVPDFTLEDRWGRIWYLEHLGMLRSAEYRERWVNTQLWYERHQRGRLLLTTAEGLAEQLGRIVSAMAGQNAAGEAGLRGPRQVRGGPIRSRYGIRTRGGERAEESPAGS